MSKIDWLQIKEIADTVRYLREARALGPSEEPCSQRSLGNTSDQIARRNAQSKLYPEGKQLTLTVTVTDPEIAQAVLQSVCAKDGSLVPGMAIKAVTVQPENRDYEVVVGYLENLLSDLRNRGS